MVADAARADRMTLSDVGVPGQRVDLLSGGDVTPTGRLLSVAEIQQAFRQLCAYAATARSGRAIPAAPPPPMSTPGPVTQGYEVAVTADPEDTRFDPAAPPPADRGDRLAEGWLAVLAAHAGAGASTVALAVTDALAAAGRTPRLIEAAQPSKSGLAGAAAAEMGLDSSGAWRRGAREMATIYRRASEVDPAGWPDPAPAVTDTVVDLGLPTAAGLDRLAGDRPDVVLVCRPSIPGVRMAEQTLIDLEGLRVAVAAIGPKRWPGEVTASLGPRLRGARDAGLVVAVDLDRRLQVTGLTQAALPKPLLRAAAELLRLVLTPPVGAASTWAHSALRLPKKGTTR
jgi:hypothetical protein